MTRARHAGLVLAGGSGSRFAREAPAGAGPKTLLRDESGRSLLAHAVETLAGAGCDPVAVVVGAHAEAVTAEVKAVAARMTVRAGDGVDARVVVVPCPDWAEGMGASLRAGLAALVGESLGGDSATGSGEVAEAPDREAPAAVVVTLADLPGQAVAVARRVIESVPAGGSGRATFGGRPGHPVVLGPDVWGDVLARVGGDVGAREVLRARGATTVECGDLAEGGDVDRPADLARTQREWGTRE
ncbi:nucleotidyltransferase family protein [Mobilicoccus pelagius]|uniref:MobA-like NTP transferase domain-containing protein n=1 Tax=Mobilicoccus pelagius NBRC 104925 TaxID=1089455 RepID=H5URI5_9MICO|nr:nucleotidyltransferase family protein [Mobilicoccus pelagius]GAB48343.1 hypothetical protein MOPEL_071_00590 [Mobilicoccus pelagius NBRC 104925]